MPSSLRDRWSHAAWFLGVPTISSDKPARAPSSGAEELSGNRKEFIGLRFRTIVLSV